MPAEVTGEHMSDNDATAIGGHGEAEAHHRGDTADESHGHADDAHGSETLGPIDVQAWGALALGIGLGLIVALCISFSTGAL
jgi:hypothetical protein